MFSDRLLEHLLPFRNWPVIHPIGAAWLLMDPLNNI
jgi:hypothetical protein